MRRNLYLQLTYGTLVYIGKLIKLKNLVLDKCYGLSNFEPIANLINLETFKVAVSNIIDDDLYYEIWDLNKIFINSPTLKNYFKIILSTFKGIF